MRARWIAIAATAVLALGCRQDAPEEKTAASDRKTADAKDEEAPPEAEEPDVDPERAHRVVFADRTSMGYLLLLPDDDKPSVPSRNDLEREVDRAFPGKPSEEVALLKTLVHIEPHDTPRDAADPNAPESFEDTRAEKARGSDLLGLHVDVVPIGIGEDALIPSLAYEDPVLLRELEAAEVEQMRRAKWAMLLRADYRSRFNVRGLRLLQALVRVMAKRHGALIFDPDTLETVNEAAFARRRLTSELAHVADQVVVVPFPDPRHGDEYLRLTTRGMRRFGSPELELDGLQSDPLVLQRGTELLHAIARVLVEVAELDESGLAIELDEELDIEVGDAVAAYAGRDYEPPICGEGCPGMTQLHLVRRDAEAHDPKELPVVRVVAPRETSDAPKYDHPKWVQSALADVFGNPS